jgi:WD40 repeat protein/uncharacterized caspase-like protein
MFHVYLRKLAFCVVVVSGVAGLAQTQPLRSAPHQVTPSNPWKDLRLVRWSTEINQGLFDQVLRDVEQDLVRPSPHPFAVDIWCRLHLRRDDIDSASDAIADPALKRALGIAPRLYSLNAAGKIDELHRVATTLTPADISGSFTYLVLIDNALLATDFDLGFKFAVQAMKQTETPNFMWIWLSMNLQEDDIRLASRYDALLTTDKDFAATPSGIALKSYMQIRDITNSNTNCRDRVPDGDRKFVAIAKEWLEMVPGDAGAHQFVASHTEDLNDVRGAAQKEVEAALAAYPMLRLRTGLDVALEANFRISELIKPDPDADGKGRELALRWEILAHADPAQQKAEAAADSAIVLRELSSNCGANPRTYTAGLWLHEAETSNSLSQISLISEQTELQLAEPDDEHRAAALADARKVWALKESTKSAILLMRALLNTQKDADAAEALLLFRDAAKRFPDHPDDFYTTGDSVLQQTGTCQDRVAIWHNALEEFPNGDWVLLGLAKAQDECGQSANVQESMNELFKFSKPTPRNLPVLETVWAHARGMDDLPHQRSVVMKAFPAQFSKIQEPAVLTRIFSGLSDPPSLVLVPQTPPSSSLSRIAQSADGRLFASADISGVVKLWTAQVPPHGATAAHQNVCASIIDPTCPRLLRNIVAHRGRIDDLAFSTDGKLLVTASEADAAVAVWRVDTGQQVWHMETPSASPHIAIRPGGTQEVAILTLYDSGWALLTSCSLTEPTPCRSLGWYSDLRVYHSDKAPLVWSANGNYLLAQVSTNETILLDWNSPHAQLLRKRTTPATATYRSDLASVLLLKDSSLMLQDLTTISKPVPVASFSGRPLDQQMLPDGRVRYAVEERIEPPISSGAGSDDDTSKPKARPRHQVNVYEVQPPGTALNQATNSPGADPKLVASFEETIYPGAKLRFDSAADDRLVIFSTQKEPVSEIDPRPMAVAYLGSAPDQLIVQRLSPHRQEPPNSVAFSADGSKLVVGRGDSSGHTQIDFWDLTISGHPTQLAKQTRFGPYVAITANSMVSCVFSIDGDGTIQIDDLHGTPKTSDTPADCLSNRPVVASADGVGSAWVSAFDTATVRSLDGSTWNAPQIAAGDEIFALATTSDVLLVASQTLVFKQEKGGSAMSLCGADACLPDDVSFSGLAVDMKGNYAIAAIGPAQAHTVPGPSAKYGILVFDLHGGSRRLEQGAKGGQQPAVTAVAFLPHTSLYAAGTIDGSVLLARADNSSPGDYVQELSPGQSPVAALSFSPDGKYLAAAFESGSVLLWKVNPALSQPGVAPVGTSELARLDTFADGDWSVINPASGQYDAMHDGKLDELLWVYGTSTMQLNQMVTAYYRSRLLPRLLSSESALKETDPSPPLDKFHPALPPEVSIVSIDVAQGEVVLKTDASAAQVRVFVNNAPLSMSAQFKDASGLLHVDLTRSHALAPGKSTDLSVVASNADDSLSGRALHKVIIAQASTSIPHEKPQFYAIIAGISTYGANVKPLPLADADAREMARDLARGASHLLGADSVHIYLLTSDEDQGKALVKQLQDAGLKDAHYENPTHDKLLGAFAWARNATLRQDDTFLLFLAGHGDRLKTGKDTVQRYIFPTSEFSLSDKPAVGTYLSAWDLEQNLLDLGVKNTILLFDTCHAGAYLSDFAAQQDEVRATIKASLREAPYMLMGAAPDDLAYDKLELGHGFLTAGLIISMRESTRRGDELSAEDWLQGAERKTELIAAQYGYMQHPPETSGGETLKVTKLSETDMQCIPDLNFAPLIGPSTVTIADPNGNPTNPLRDAVLKLLSAQKENPNEPPLTVYSVDDSPVLHLAVSGNYTIAAGYLTISDLRLFYGKDKDSEPPLQVQFDDSLSTAQKEQAFSDLARIITDRIDTFSISAWKGRQAEQSPECSLTF